MLFRSLRTALVLPLALSLPPGTAAFAQNPPPPRTGAETPEIPDSAPAQSPRPPDAVAGALAAAASGSFDTARVLAARAGPVLGDLVEWHRLRRGDGSLAEIAEFLRRRADWPGLDQIRSRGERRLHEITDPEEMRAFLGPRGPRTLAGVTALAEALRAADKPEEARDLLREAWGDLTLTEADQQALRDLAGDALDDSHHAARLDHLLWENRSLEAEQMLPLVSSDLRNLAEARLALRANRDAVDAILAAVPEELAKDPGLAHARFEWLMRRSRNEEAAALLKAQSASAAQLGRAEAWSRRRATLARSFLREGKAALAYDLAAAHHLSRGAQMADLEFLAGFIALRFLDKPHQALGHFDRLAASVSTPISLARAHYWQGRAAEAGAAPGDSAVYFHRAAQHQTTYYGLLAAEKLGLSLQDDLVRPAPLPDWRTAGFLGSSVTEAGLLLLAAGDAVNGRRFLLHLADGLSEAEIPRLGALALAQGDPHLAVLLGKKAAARGQILPQIYFPDTNLLPEALAVERPLALAIARRESEFRVDAVSPAGALGLMQLMPGTAKLMAEKLGLRHEVAALTRDPHFNARLGAAYLAHLAEEFGPSLALRAAGYNAGPGRPRTWIGLIGDPRLASVDVIDWVEQVPFEETRTYIMRVAEGRVIYGAREAPGQPVALTALLRGR